MLDVFFTVDVEVWCDDWSNIDATFPEAFQRYTYGPTPQGDYGLPFTLKLLNDSGLTGVFFVEPLFATRFGTAPLEEIIGLIRSASQEVQLHLHTEWADEAHPPLIEGMTHKRQHLRYFSCDEQTSLIATGKRLIEAAGSGEVCAFRAGSFGFNRDTLHALRENDIAFDSSYNASMFGLDSGVMPGTTLVDVTREEGVYLYPMTVYRDGTSTLRHAQLSACSFMEMEGLLWQALEQGRKSFVILSHNFELLNTAKTRPDALMVSRFRKLCTFLARNSDVFRVRGFHGLQPQLSPSQPQPLTSPVWKTGIRMLQQFYRRRYQ